MHPFVNNIPTCCLIEVSFLAHATPLRIAKGGHSPSQGEGSWRQICLEMETHKKIAHLLIYVLFIMFIMFSQLNGHKSEFQEKTPWL